MNWGATEFESIDLGDPRRNWRAIRLVERLSANPTASIPQACGDWADTISAYRFFGNEEFEWADILALERAYKGDSTSARTRSKHRSIASSTGRLPGACCTGAGANNCDQAGR